MGCASPSSNPASGVAPCQDAPAPPASGDPPVAPPPGARAGSGAATTRAPAAIPPADSAETNVLLRISHPPHTAPRALILSPCPNRGNALYAGADRCPVAHATGPFQVCDV